MTTVKDLREIAESILEQLEGVDENKVIYTVTNTYFVGSNTIIETHDGFLDYCNIRLEGEDDEEDDEDW